MYKKKKSGLRLSDYEGYSYGPIKVERIGRVVSISSNWEPERFKNFIERIRCKRPELKRRIGQNIDKLLSLIAKYEPLELLSTVSAKNCIGNPEEYKESTYEGKECYAEYAQSLILSQNRQTNVKHASEEAIEQFNQLIHEVFMDGIHYFGSERAEGKRDEVEEELRFFSLLKYLFVRGDSYQEHHLEMLKDILKTQDNFFKKHYGFDSEKVFQAIDDIDKQLLANIRHNFKMMSLLRELHELYKKFLDTEGENSFASLDDCRKKYLTLPTVQEKMKELDNIRNNSKEFLFQVIPTKKAPLELLKLLSANLGDNLVFSNFEKAPCWPTNDSIIYERPLIEESGKFYCFVPQVMTRNIGNILEAWIKEKDSDYYNEVYQTKRADYLELKTIEYLKNILPDAEIYGKLFYKIVENGENKRPETDGLILYDESLFIIEVKAGEFSTSSRRGGLKRMRKDIENLIDDAYIQALRTKNYILGTPEPTFEYENGKEALIIKNKNKYKQIYLLNITLQSLGKIATQLDILRKIDFIKGSEWLWSVFINDLRVISEIIEFPSEFLHYLQQRMKANDHPQFRAEDELDIFMFYLREGLYFEGEVLAKGITYRPSGYIEDLDRFYDYAAGRVSTGEKPKLRMPEEYKHLLTEIEATGKYRFTKVTTTLLNVDLATKKMILTNIEKAEEASKKDGRDHDFTMYFEKLRFGLMFSVSVNRKHNFVEILDHHCELKLYQTKFKDWICVIINVGNNGKRNLDFRIYQKEWNYNQDVEKKLNIYKTLKLDKFKKTGQKIDRNDPCPCNSGLKYKKCCGLFD
jgi:hypothetical protein